MVGSPVSTPPLSSRGLSGLSPGPMARHVLEDERYRGGFSSLDHSGAFERVARWVPGTSPVMTVEYLDAVFADVTKDILQ
jgi:hypothetical protein